MQKHCPKCHRIVDLTKDNFTGVQKFEVLEYGFKKEVKLYLHNCLCGNTVSTYTKAEGVDEND